MDIIVEGGQVLKGKVTPSGSKNSAVALLASSILFDKPVVFTNIPNITDVSVMLSILKKMGGKVKRDEKKNSVEIDNSQLSFKKLDSKDLGNLRGTSLLWGPLLARFKKVGFKDLPGGCTLGVRPLDTHYLAFRDLGVSVQEDRSSVEMDASKAKGSDILLYEMSPTATENLIMLAVGLNGKTRISGAASEPQVQDLCRFLIKCGANISGVGSNIIEIEGGKYLEPVKHNLYCDHYEITTYLALAAATGGGVEIETSLNGVILNIIKVFERFGLEVKYTDNKITLEPGQKVSISGANQNKTLHIKAQPWPGLPVDTLPLFIPLALAANKGQVVFHNWMYEAGLFWTSELTKLGANIIMGDPHRVIVTSGNKLEAATMEAPYIIRAVVAMVMSAMIAKGESKILDADALYRGHPKFAENLQSLGAKIKVIEEAARKSS